jgi:chromosome segregation ATPase
VADDDREVAKYTETQLQTLVVAGVERQTAALTQANEELQSQVDTLTTTNAELETKVTGLETEVAAERAAKEKAEQDFADYKAEQERAAEQARLQQERVDAIKEAAHGLHADDYYTEERASKWAAMPEEAFADVVEAVKAAADAAGVETAEDTGADADKGRETAAFTGGGKPTKTKGDEQASTTRQFLAAGGRIPAGV